LGTLVQVFFFALLAVAVGAIIYLLAQAFAARRKREDSSRETVADGDAAAVESLPVPATARRGDLLAEARRHYAAGNFALAIIYLFSFQLVQLDKRQIIHLAKGKTNRQYLREIGPRAGLATLVEQTMVIFEDVFFGNHGLERDRFESCWGRLGEFESLVGEGVASG
jgi:hypothetical protein